MCSYSKYNRHALTSHIQQQQCRSSICSGQSPIFSCGYSRHSVAQCRNPTIYEANQLSELLWRPELMPFVQLLSKKAVNTGHLHMLGGVSQVNHVLKRNSKPFVSLNMLHSALLTFSTIRSHWTLFPADHSVIT